MPNDPLRAIREQRLVVDQLAAQLVIGPNDNEALLKARLALEREKLDRMEGSLINCGKKPPQV